MQLKDKNITDMLLFSLHTKKTCFVCNFWKKEGAYCSTHITYILQFYSSPQREAKCGDGLQVSSKKKSLYHCMYIVNSVKSQKIIKMS